LLATSLIADIARVLLGLAILVAAIAKIASGQRWVDQASALGVTRSLAVVLPWFELAVGAAVVTGVAEPWPAAIAVGLLVVFTAWIVIHLVRGEHPPCACFGSFSSAPLSWWHAARNVALIALGVAAVLS
jgi:uncharacterized membrane protein YphA (DoxX/SURF4 family)